MCNLPCVRYVKATASFSSSLRWTAVRWGPHIKADPFSDLGCPPLLIVFGKQDTAPVLLRRCAIIGTSLAFAGHGCLQRTRADEGPTKSISWPPIFWDWPCGCHLQDMPTKFHLPDQKVAFFPLNCQPMVPKLFEGGHHILYMECHHLQRRTHRQTVPNLIRYQINTVRTLSVRRTPPLSY